MLFGLYQFGLRMEISLMRRDYTAIVLGIGGIGSAALYWLARRLGDHVLGIEQFGVGHEHGGSHDHSRIIRLSYHTPAYVRLAKQAYAAWSTVEEDHGQPLILKTGGLDFAPPNSAIPIADYTTSLMAENVPFEMLEPAELMRRWPQFKLADDTPALYQSESGIAPAAKCVAAHVRLAQQHGAQLIENAPVTQIREVDGEVEVIANGVAYRCQKLVIAAGAWSNQHLAHFDIHLPLTVTKEQVVYYDAANPDDFAPDKFPIWIWMDEPCYYGFPVYGENGPKIAQDVGGKETTPETRTYETDEDALKRVDDFTRRLIPSAHAKPIYVKTCLYTMPPDREFVLDFIPHSQNILCAIGAGHAFKFSSVLGKALSELSLDGRSQSDLSAFAFDRPILWEENPATNFMV